MTAAARLRPWIGFTAMAVGMFMAILDIQIVASSLPEIEAGLGLPLERLSWVQTAYLMAEIVAIPLTGWLTRALSLRGAFLAGLGGFVMASLGCAVAPGFWTMIPARAVQGFCGGALIPLVFSAIFLMFEDRARPRATLIAGSLAMLAPTLGPVVGGLVTDHLSWRWLFLINLPPGVAVALTALWSLAGERRELHGAAALDFAALPLLAVFLAGLELWLKEAPQRGWASPPMLVLAVVSAACGGALISRSLRHPAPLVDLRAFREPNFALGCGLSFALGVGLYGASFLLPLFLGLVRSYDALPTGAIMIVTGAAQLLMAPVATMLERRSDARRLALAGYALLALGWLGNGFMTAATDFWGLFWQQSARGAAVMLCLLSSTALALGGFDPARVPNASGLFNLMRNLGGAIGLAVIDTILVRRAPEHVADLVARLQAGDAAAAAFVGLPTERFTGAPIGPVDEATRNLVAPLVERAGLVAAFNDAWLWIGGALLLSLLMVPWLRAAPRGLETRPREHDL